MSSQIQQQIEQSQPLQQYPRPLRPSDPSDPLKLPQDDDKAQDDQQLEDSSPVTAAFCRALHDYERDEPTGLSFRRGDTIEVLTIKPSGWWDGLLGGNKRGWFPANYVTIISETEAKAILASQETPPENQQIDTLVDTMSHAISGNSQSDNEGLRSNGSEKDELGEINSARAATSTPSRLHIHDVTTHTGRRSNRDLVDSDLPHEGSGSSEQDEPKDADPVDLWGEEGTGGSERDELGDLNSEEVETLIETIKTQKPDVFSDVSNILKVVLLDKDKYKKLLNLDRSTAQTVLDILQTTLDYIVTNSVDSKFENMLLKAMLHISKRSTLCPRSYVLSDIERDEYPIAFGHFGEIFQGRYKSRTVSLKVFKLYMNQMSKANNLVKAFYREAILWRHLMHPNLLPFYGIYQLGDSGGRTCLVSPWMRNGNITQYIQQYPNANRPHLILDVARGISYLHEKSIVHGDLKGVNVLISDNGIACLADFGLSSVITSHSLAWTSIESTVSSMGTVRWQAPELILDNEEEPSVGVTKGGDIYAFACVCYEIITGKLPFYQFPVDATVIFKVMSGQRPQRPSGFDPQRGLTEWMWSLIEECWDQEPVNRPAASEIVARLSPLFSRDIYDDNEVDDGDSWGDLRPEVFKSLVDERSLASEEDIQSVMSLLNSI